MANANRICSIPGCNKPHEAHGWCVAHYKRWQRSGAPEFLPKQPKPPCSVQGCAKPFKARGLCQDHYHRFMKYGDPLAGPTVRGAPEAFFKQTVLAFDGDECLIWPYAIGSHGYGTATIDGKRVTVHRAACEARNGPPLGPEYEAAHNCGNRPCCNPKHLRWATRPENIEDMVAHDTHHRGERQWKSRLTEDQVREIRTLQGTATAYRIAKRYGVSAGAINAIFSGRSWNWLE